MSDNDLKIANENKKKLNDNFFSISKDKIRASKELKELCYKMFKTEKLLKNTEDDFEQYIQFYKIKQIKNVVLNAEMISTVNSYFENGMNTSLASVAGYMHRNTMVYRLQKVKNVIGLDIRNFNDAVVYKNMLLYFEFIKK